MENKPPRKRIYSNTQKIENNMDAQKIDLQLIKELVLTSSDIATLDRCDIDISEIINDCHLKLIPLRDDKNGNSQTPGMEEATIKSRLNLATRLHEVCLAKKNDLRKQNGATGTVNARRNYQFRMAAKGYLSQDDYNEISRLSETIPA